MMAARDSRAGTQAGAAAVEIAVAVLVVLLLAMVLLGSIALVWGQQRVTQLAADQARMLLVQYQRGERVLEGGAAQDHFIALCRAMASGSPVLRAVAQGEAQAGCEARAVPCPGGGACAQIRVQAPAQGWPLLGMLLNAYRTLSGQPSADGAVLRAQAVVKLPL